MEVLTERAEEIFYSALEMKSPDQRKVFLDRACQGDGNLRTVVERLLASQPKAEKFFQEGGRKIWRRGHPIRVRRIFKGVSRALR